MNEKEQRFLVMPKWWIDNAKKLGFLKKENGNFVYYGPLVFANGCIILENKKIKVDTNEARRIKKTTMR